MLKKDQFYIFLKVTQKTGSLEFEFFADTEQLLKKLVVERE